jgi:hypothetical protein
VFHVDKGVDLSQFVQGHENNYTEKQTIILEDYENQFDDQNEVPVEILDYSGTISDENIVTLTSDIAGRKSKR